jgi:hypothetical protein
MPPAKKIGLILTSLVVIFLIAAFIWGYNSNVKTSPVVSTIENCLFYFWLLLLIFSIGYWVFKKVAK